MNRYGAMAKAHWAEYLPSRYRQIEDPETFFEQLGVEADREVAARVAAMPTGEVERLPEDERPGWWNMARLMAEEAVVREMLLVDPEETDDELDGPPGPMYRSMLAEYLAAEEELLESGQYDA